MFITCRNICGWQQLKQGPTEVDLKLEEEKLNATTIHLVVAEPRRFAGDPLQLADFQASLLVRRVKLSFKESWADACEGTGSLFEGPQTVRVSESLDANKGNPRTSPLLHHFIYFNATNLFCLRRFHTSQGAFSVVVFSRFMPISISPIFDRKPTPLMNLYFIGSNPPNSHYTNNPKDGSTLRSNLLWRVPF